MKLSKLTPPNYPQTSPGTRFRRSQSVSLSRQVSYEKFDRRPITQRDTKPARGGNGRGVQPGSFAGPSPFGDRESPHRRGTRADRAVDPREDRRRRPASDSRVGAAARFASGLPARIARPRPRENLTL